MSNEPSEAEYAERVRLLRLDAKRGLRPHEFRRLRELDAKIQRWADHITTRGLARGIYGEDE